MLTFLCEFFPNKTFFFKYMICTQTKDQTLHAVWTNKLQCICKLQIQYNAKKNQYYTEIDSSKLSVDIL